MKALYIWNYENFKKDTEQETTRWKTPMFMDW
jgi:hypothetical protein